MRGRSWLTRWAPMLLMMSLVATTSGCLGNYAQKDFFTTAGAAAGAGLGLAVGLPPMGTIASTMAGATATAVLVEGNTETVEDILNQLPEEERADAYRAIQIAEVIESWGKWIIAAVAAWFFIPLVLGYFIPRRSEVKMRRRLFDDPNTKMKDL